MVNKERFEAIEKTLKDFPFSSLKQIAERTGIPKSSVERLLHSNGYVAKNLKWIPYILNSSQKVSRVNQSKRLLKILQAAKENDYKFLITGDDSWFYLSADHKIQWVAPGQKPMKRGKKMIGSKKCMLTVFWNLHGIYLVNYLPENTKFNVTDFVNEILTPLDEITSEFRENTEENLILHYDNARPHTSRKVLEYLECLGMEKALQSAFSPDLVPSDFILFGYIKTLLAGRSFKSPKELLSGVNEFLTLINGDRKSGKTIKFNLIWNQSLPREKKGKNY